MTRINVTKTFLPPIEEYQAYIRQIWENDQLTNQGPLLRQFEANMAAYLGVRNFQFVANGTIALQVAIRALGIEEGEIITTPFTYVATTSSVLWERCQPVYVDIEPDSFVMDPRKIESAITSRTRAIMPVHVFGRPCDVEAIDVIAKKHKLKVIYDAAHAFGVKYKGKSLLDYGDISICSFHATKLFHTIEGGGIIARDKRLNEKIDLMKRFGHTGDEHRMLGINAKANEFEAAMGLCNLKYVDEVIAQRKKLANLYDKLLGKRRSYQPASETTKYNYPYYPVLLQNEKNLETVLTRLNESDIHPRRYFYPSLNTLTYVRANQSAPISEDIASRVLCLPFYVGLDMATVEKVCGVIKTYDV